METAWVWTTSLSRVSAVSSRLAASTSWGRDSDMGRRTTGSPITRSRRTPSSTEAEARWTTRISWPAAAMEAAWRATKTPRPGERCVGNQVVTMVTRMMLPREPVRAIIRAGAQ